MGGAVLYTHYIVTSIMRMLFLYQERIALAMYLPTGISVMRPIGSGKTDGLNGRRALDMIRSIYLYFVPF
jgi:hypothetical protein